MFEAYPAHVTIRCWVEHERSRIVRVTCGVCLHRITPRMKANLKVLRRLRPGLIEVTEQLLTDLGTFQA